MIVNRIPDPTIIGVGVDTPTIHNSRKLIHINRTPMPLNFWTVMA